MIFGIWVFVSCVLAVAVALGVYRLAYPKHVRSRELRRWLRAQDRRYGAVVDEFRQEARR